MSQLPNAECAACHGMGSVRHDGALLHGRTGMRSHVLGVLWHGRARSRCRHRVHRITPNRQGRRTLESFNALFQPGQAAGDQRFQRHQDQPRVAGEDPVVVVRRSHQAGDDQLPHLQAGARRSLLREDLRPDHRLGMPLRQVQADEAPRRHLRQVRRRSHEVQSPPRAHGSHRARLAGLARLVLQGPAVAHRPPARHLAPRPRAHPLLRVVRRHRSGRPRRRRSTRKSCSPRSGTASCAASTATSSSPRWAPRRSRSCFAG